MPILGYLISRGRARCCGARLTPRYLWVEVLTALLALVVVEQWMVGRPEVDLTEAAVAALAVFLFVGGLLIASIVDLEWMEIPDEVSLPGAAVGLASAAFRPEVSTADAALGAGAGFLLVQVLFVWGYERLTGRRGMGEGDSKLLLFIGAFVGWQGALFALVAGSLQGLIASIVLQLTGRELTVAEPPHAYGNIEVPGGRLFVDIGRVRVGSDTPGQVFVTSGRFEVDFTKEATAPLRIATAACTLEPQAGTLAGIEAGSDGSTAVDVERGGVVLRWLDGDETVDVSVGTGAAARISLDGTLRGPGKARDIFPSGEGAARPIRAGGPRDAPGPVPAGSREAPTPHEPSTRKRRRGPTSRVRTAPSSPRS